MSASLRFLAVAVIGWAAVRAATLGSLPGAEAFSVARAQPAPAQPVAASEFPPMSPIPAAPYEALPPGYVLVPASAMAPRIHYYPVPAPMPAAVPAAAPQPPPAAVFDGYYDLSASRPVFLADIPPLDDWPLSEIASGARPARTASPVAAPGAPPRPGLDRLRLTSWALLRNRPGPGTLASGGTLGGSQAGARLTYAVTPWLAGSLRTSAPVGGSAQGGEVAAGVRLTPLRAIPVSITAERRQSIGRFGGRSAFALFLEGGVYQRPLPWRFSLDAYAQGGVVGINRRDLFADGALAFTRPVHGRLSAGFGLWGGAQPGLYRVDAGPRLSLRVRDSMRVDLDWRQRLAGHAEPGSGPAVTLAADF